MLLTTRVRYGVRALIEMGIADGPVLLKQISEKQNLSLKYLDHIFTGLKAKGIIRKIKAKKGGYLLSKNPKDITLYDIIDALGGFEKIECLLDSSLCPRVDGCGARIIWKRLNDKIIYVLKSITLEDFIKEQKKLRDKKI
ncbi:MAG: Rrf2 family transcriptional regulator [Candidatus Omnitrophica bacterium]|nr:Rrf2 family transcriptional regulator [Candidatus Omnitrophota bacterium]